MEAQDEKKQNKMLNSSYLKSFAADLEINQTISAGNDYQKLVAFMGSFSDKTISKSNTKGDTINTNQPTLLYSSSDYISDNYAVDPYDENEPVDYGVANPYETDAAIPIVIIQGVRYSSGWWNFGRLYVDTGELTVMSGSPSPCGGNPPGNSVDWGFISAREGDTKTGTVPKDSTGKVLGTSGVTIASGFDLGAHNAADLASMNLSQATIDKLTPYLGLQQNNAVNYLAAHPLTITSDEDTAINSAAHTTSLGNLALAFDNAVGVDQAFWQLPAGAQTAIASVAFQYGNLATKAPNFWNEITHYDWTDAVANLKNFGDAYPTRRNLEANLLQNAINAGQLPNNTHC